MVESFLWRFVCGCVKVDGSKSILTIKIYQEDKVSLIKSLKNVENHFSFPFWEAEIIGLGFSAVLLTDENWKGNFLFLQTLWFFSVIVTWNFVHLTFHLDVMRFIHLAAPRFCSAQAEMPRVPHLWLPP